MSRAALPRVDSGFHRYSGSRVLREAFDSRGCWRTINRGMRSLTIGFRERGVGYVILLSLFVVTTGAAGMYRFELDTGSGPGFPDYATVLWWTAMLLTTMGTDYWPQTCCCSTTPDSKLLLSCDTC